MTFDLRGGILDRVQARVQASEEIEFGITRANLFLGRRKGGCKSTVARALTGLAPHQRVIRFAGSYICPDREPPAGLGRMLA